MLKNLSDQKKAIYLTILWYALAWAGSAVMYAYANAISVSKDALLEHAPLSGLALMAYIIWVSLPILRRIKKHATAANLKLLSFFAKVFLVQNYICIVLLPVLMVINLF